MILILIAVVNLTKGEETDIQVKKEIEVIANDTVEESFNEGSLLKNVAQDFILETAGGAPVRLSDYKGKKVILNFWTTWCPPCKAEMPHLQTFYEENRQDEVEILSINLTQLDHGLKTIQNFIDNYQLTFPVALDKKDIVGQMYEIMTIPTTFFIDENGVIQQKIIGPMDKESMKQAIETF